MSSLYKYQRRAVRLLHLRNGCAGLFMEMGTGKTRVALTYCKEVSATRILVGCPVAAAGVWRNEIKRKLKLPWRGLNLSRRSINEREHVLRTHGASIQVVVVNLNVLWRPTARALKDSRPGPRNRARAQKRLVDTIEKWAPDTIIYDEAHRIKNKSSRQSRYAWQLGRKPFVKRRLALTGTHVTQGLEDLFAIYRFIDPSIFGTRWDAFAAEYCRFGGYFNHEIVGYKNEAKLRRLLRRTSFEIAKSEALDLPERQDVPVPFALGPRAQAQYDKFKAEAVAEIEGLDENGQPKHGFALARIMLTVLIRLHQLTSGFIETDTGRVFTGRDKLDTTLDLTEDALAQRQAVVIFCLFVPDIEALLKALPKKVTVGVYAGGKWKRKRESDLRAFQRGKRQVMIVQVQAGSESIDLSVSHVAIFHSLSSSLKDYAQARDRLHRIGQRNAVTYYYPQAVGTIDVKILKDLGGKQDVASRVSNLDYCRRLLA